jgi:DNA-binding NtrC family response regulator
MIQDFHIRIFVVDDEPFYLNVFEQYLLNLGYVDVSTFQNGNDCLTALHQKPDVVFLDYQMDDLSGYEVLKKIKRKDPNIYVVMISGQEEIGPAIESLKHGAFDYLQKGEYEEIKIKEVLDRILEVRDFMARNKPGFMKSVLKFL